MEFCAGGDLSRFIRMRRILPEKVARIFLQQLGEGPLPGSRTHSVGHPSRGFFWRGGVGLWRCPPCHVPVCPPSLRPEVPP